MIMCLNPAAVVGFFCFILIRLLFFFCELYFIQASTADGENNEVGTQTLNDVTTQTPSDVGIQTPSNIGFQTASEVGIKGLWCM